MIRAGFFGGRHGGSGTFFRIVCILTILLLAPTLAIYLTFAARHQCIQNNKAYEQACDIAQIAAQTIENEFEGFASLSTEMSQLVWVKKICSNYRPFYEEYMTSPIMQKEVRTQLSLLNRTFSRQTRIGIFVKSKELIISPQTIGDAFLFFSDELSAAAKEDVFEYMTSVDHFTLTPMDEICGEKEEWLLLCSPIPISTANQPILFQVIKSFYLDAYIQKMGIIGLKNIRISSINGETIYTYSPNSASGTKSCSNEFIFPSYNLRFVIEVGYESANWFQWMLRHLAVVLLLILLCVGTALMLAEILYAPLHTLSMRFSGGTVKSIPSPLNIVTKDAEFQRIEQAIDQLDKDFRSSSQMLSESQDRIRQDLIYRLINGQSGQDDSIEGLFHCLHIPFKMSDSYMVCVLTIKEPEDIALVHCGMQYSLKQSGLATLLYDFDDSIILILRIDPYSSKNNIFRQVDAALRNIDFIASPPAVAWGTVENGYKGIEKSYRNAINRDKSRLVAANVAVADKMGWMSDLATAITGSNVEKVCSILDDLQKKQDTILAQLRTQLNIMDVACKSMPNKQISSMLAEQFEQQVMMCPGDKRWDVLRKILQETVSDVPQTKPYTSSDDIMHYIDTHYTDTALSLQELSDVFHLSVPQISKIVKSAAQMNFLEYLHRLRVVYAKTLLNKGEFNLKEVRKRSGFDNDATFTRVFTKLEHITPSKYLSAICSNGQKRERTITNEKESKNK